ncbi:MAG: preprotein translocase subunit SecE [Minisyncoccia bacterium]
MNLLTYLKHVRAELAHVVWPDTRTAIAHTLLVIVLGAAVALLVGGLDTFFTSVVTRAIENF